MLVSITQRELQITSMLIYEGPYRQLLQVGQDISYLYLMTFLEWFRHICSKTRMIYLIILKLIRHWYRLKQIEMSEGLELIMVWSFVTRNSMIFLLNIVEKMNNTLVNKVRCMLMHSKFSMSLWAEVLSTTCYIINSSPSSEINFKTLVKLYMVSQQIILT